MFYFRVTWHFTSFPVDAHFVGVQNVITHDVSGKAGHLKTHPFLARSLLSCGTTQQQEQARWQTSGSPAGLDRLGRIISGPPAPSLTSHTSLRLWNLGCHYPSSSWLIWVKEETSVVFFFFSYSKPLSNIVDYCILILLIGHVSRAESICDFFPPLGDFGWLVRNIAYFVLLISCKARPII